MERWQRLFEITLRHSRCNRGSVCAAWKGRVQTPRAWWATVNQVMAHLGWIASSLGTLSLKGHEQRRTNFGLCCIHIDNFLVALDEGKRTRQHFDALKQQFQWGSHGKMLTLSSVACIFVKTACTTGGVKSDWTSAMSFEWSRRPDIDTLGSLSFSRTQWISAVACDKDDDQDSS